jgi:hypothetical protein
VLVAHGLQIAEEPHFLMLLASFGYPQVFTIKRAATAFSD